jgi:hypothetical protein
MKRTKSQKPRKLEVKPETVQRLSSDDLVIVVGGKHDGIKLGTVACTTGA